jgi:PHD/YefM family antitoxin component YafN of YafNO toxin-antitoxin module
MPKKERITETLSTTDASDTFPELVRKVSGKGARVIVEENGKAVAAIVSVLDLERLNRLDQKQDKAWEVFEEIHARNAQVDPDEVERDVAEALAEVRAQVRAEKERD